MNDDEKENITEENAIHIGHKPWGITGPPKEIAFVHFYQSNEILIICIQIYVGYVLCCSILKICNRSFTHFYFNFCVCVSFTLLPISLTNWRVCEFFKISSLNRVNDLNQQNEKWLFSLQWSSKLHLLIKWTPISWTYRGIKFWISTMRQRHTHTERERKGVDR